MIAVRIIRPCLVAGRRVEAGQVVKCPPRDALGVIEAGRGVLADPTDAPELHACLEADTKRAIARDGRPWAGPQPGAPWQRFGV